MKLSRFVSRIAKPVERQWASTTSTVIHKQAQKSKEHDSKSTVDAADVQHHAEQMDHWWEKKGPMKALHAMNLLRVPFVRDGLVSCAEGKQATPLKGTKILDIGCGGGILSEGLARIGAKVTGIDASKDLIELAKQHADRDPKIADNKPEYIYTTVEEHADTHKEHYDAVVASEIIEHVNNKDLFIQKCVDSLKTGGRIFFTTPNRTRITQIAGIYIAEYVLNILPKGTHQYEKFITPSEITIKLERNKCHVEAIQGLFYNVLTNEWQWMNSHSFVYALQAVKLAKSNSDK